MCGFACSTHPWPARHTLALTLDIYMLDCQLLAGQGVTLFPRGDALVSKIIL